MVILNIITRTWLIGVGFAIYIRIATTDFNTVKAQFWVGGGSLPISIKFAVVVNMPRLVSTILIRLKYRNNLALIIMNRRNIAYYYSLNFGYYCSFPP